MFPSKNVVYVDNSACRQIANKLGTGRLRHIQGKLLRIQRMTKSLGKSGSKLLGPLGTQQTLAPKTFSVDRHKMLGYMLNMLLDGDRMGEQQSLRATQADWNKHTIEENSQCFIFFGPAGAAQHCGSDEP